MIKSKEIFGIGISKEVFDVFITDKGYLKFPNKKKDCSFFALLIKSVITLSMSTNT